MNRQEGEIASKEMILSDNCMVRMSIKSSNGKIYLDMRKWYKYQNQNEFLPSRKGIMMSTKEMRVILPIIEGIINENDKD